MINKKISVIVPIYNVEKYLKRCIDSILNSTYNNLEIILVDDGSTDSCPKICDEYKKIDTRIKVIHKTNGGLSDARNKGLDIATGDFISFIDSDDYINSNMLSYLAKPLIENECDISVCDFEIFYGDSLENEMQYSDINDYNFYSSKEVLRLLLDGKKSHGDYAWNKLYKKYLFKEVRYPIGKKMEDIGTTYKLYYYSNKIAISNKKLYYYFQRKDSILGKKTFSIYSDSLELAIERYNFLKDNYALKDDELTVYQRDILNKTIDVYKNAITDEEKKYFKDKCCSKIYNDIFKDCKFKIKTYCSFKSVVKYIMYQYKFRRNK